MVYFVGSGNMLHNLRMVSWQHLNKRFAFDWAAEANDKMKSYIQEGHHESLINYAGQGRSFQLAIPTPEHYLPLLYTLGLQQSQDAASLFNDEPVACSLSMTSFKIG